MKDRISDLEDRISDLEDQISDLEDQIIDLGNQIDDIHGKVSSFLFGFRYNKETLRDLIMEIIEEAMKYYKINDVVNSEIEECKKIFGSNFWE